MDIKIRRLKATGLALVLALSIPLASARADYSGTFFYESCQDAADVLTGRPGSSFEQISKSSMCSAAISALMSLEPFFKPEYRMCPPGQSRISMYQVTLVVAAFLRNHPEKLHEDFGLLEVEAVWQAWPCPEKAP